MATLFTSGFETGDLSEWTTNFGGDLLVTALAARTGSYGARQTNTSGTRVQLKDYAAAAAARHYARFYFRIVGSPTTNTGILFIQTGGSGANTAVTLSCLTDNRIRANLNSGTFDSEPLNLNTWYRIEVFVDSTPSGANKIAECRINGVVLGRVENANFLSTAVGRLSMGVNTGSSGVELQFDDVQVNAADSGYPGGLNEPSSMNKDLLLLL